MMMEFHSRIVYLACLVICISCFVLAVDDVRLPPSILKGPVVHHIYRTDDKIELECQANGVPRPSYEWIKDGRPLNLNVGHIQREGEGKIIINNAGTSDEGYYLCQAINQYGTALSNTSHLERAVLGNVPGTPPVVQKEVYEGQPFVLQAQPLKSFPKPTYNWEIAENTVDKNPQMLSLGKRIQIADNGDLYFAYAIQSDSLGGKIYKGTTYNQYLDIKAGGSYTQVNVKPVPGGVQPFQPVLAFSSDLHAVAVEGRSITLRCFFSGNPEPSFSWRRPPPKHTLPAGRYSFGNANMELTIKDIVPNDEGDYVCTASNMQGSSQQTLQISVQAIPSFKSLDHRPHNVNATEGDSVMFYCNAYAKPLAKISWLYNGIQLTVGNLPSRFSISSDMKNLTIRNVCRDCSDRQTDLMVIQCNASNIHGYNFTAGYLNVLKKTKVSLIGDTTEVLVGMDEETTVQFQCVATSDPSTPPSIKWYKVTSDGDELVYNESRTVTVTNDGMLSISRKENATGGWSKYGGKYKCIGSNGYSKEHKTVVIQIKNAPIVDAQTASFVDYWWIFLIIALILLLWILIFCCWLYVLRNRGDKYDVDGKERLNGNDPEKELLDNGFHDYRRPETQALKGSRGSLSSSVQLNSDEDGSLNDYGDVDPSKFNEDGSFVGAYTNTADRKKGRTETRTFS